MRPQHQQRYGEPFYRCETEVQVTLLIHYYYSYHCHYCANQLVVSIFAQAENLTIVLHYSQNTTDTKVFFLFLLQPIDQRTLFSSLFCLGWVRDNKQQRHGHGRSAALITVVVLISNNRRIFATGPG